MTLHRGDEEPKKFGLGNHYFEAARADDIAHKNFLAKALGSKTPKGLKFQIPSMYVQNWKSASSSAGPWRPPSSPLIRRREDVQSTDLKVVAAQVAANEASHYSFFDAALGGHAVTPAPPAPPPSRPRSRAEAVPSEPPSRLPAPPAAGAAEPPRKGHTPGKRTCQPHHLLFLRILALLPSARSACRRWGYLGPHARVQERRHDRAVGRAASARGRRLVGQREPPAPPSF